MLPRHSLIYFSSFCIPLTVVSFRAFFIYSCLPFVHCLRSCEVLSFPLIFFILTFVSLLYCFLPMSCSFVLLIPSFLPFFSIFIIFFFSLFFLVFVAPYHYYLSLLYSLSFYLFYGLVQSCLVCFSFSLLSLAFYLVLLFLFLTIS